MADDFRNFLETKEENRRRCGTCAMTQPVDPQGRSIVDLIHEWAQARADGVSDRSQMSLHGWLVDHYDYPFGTSALHKHVVHHERELWKIFRGRD